MLPEQENRFAELPAVPKSSRFYHLRRTRVGLLSVSRFRRERYDSKKKDGVAEKGRFGHAPM
jgi:hypothetical protein